MKTFTLLLLTISLSSYAQICKNNKGDILNKSSSSKWTLVTDTQSIDLLGKEYLIDFNTTHSILLDLDLNEYSLITHTTLGRTHCRSRVCPSIPQLTTIKLSISNADYDYFNCL